MKNNSNFQRILNQWINKTFNNYYNRVSHQNTLNQEQIQRFQNWLIKEAKKAKKSKSLKYKSNFRDRIKSKLWTLENRYASNKNKRRTAVRSFIRKASWQELKILELDISKRKKRLDNKGKISHKDYMKYESKKLNK